MKAELESATAGRGRLESLAGQQSTLLAKKMQPSTAPTGGMDSNGDALPIVADATSADPFISYSVETMFSSSPAGKITDNTQRAQLADLQKQT